mmetsp:Transcript_28136/g.57060  ORF Transcript_28136/g.57060 Transcript_28136/m.57060 type:complete len:189 (-) Transcript_28136:156-722(-)
MIIRLPSYACTYADAAVINFCRPCISARSTAFLGQKIAPSATITGERLLSLKAAGSAALTTVTAARSTVQAANVAVGASVALKLYSFLHTLIRSNRLHTYSAYTVKIIGTLAGTAANTFGSVGNGTARTSTNIAFKTRAEAGIVGAAFFANCVSIAFNTNAVIAYASNAAGCTRGADRTGLACTAVTG